MRAIIRHSHAAVRGRLIDMLICHKKAEHKTDEIKLIFDDNNKRDVCPSSLSDDREHETRWHQTKYER